MFSILRVALVNWELGVQGGGWKGKGEEGRGVGVKGIAQKKQFKN